MSFRDASTSTQCHATLRLVGDLVNPDTVTEQLEIEPSNSDHAGAGDPGLWELTSRAQIDTVNLDAHIQWIVEQVEPNANRFTRLGNSKGTEVLMDCIWATDEAHGGPVVSASILARLGELRIDLVVDVHTGGATTAD